MFSKFHSNCFSNSISATGDLINLWMKWDKKTNETITFHIIEKSPRFWCGLKWIYWSVHMIRFYSILIVLCVCKHKLQVNVTQQKFKWRCWVEFNWRVKDVIGLCLTKKTETYSRFFYYKTIRAHNVKLEEVKLTYFESLLVRIEKDITSAPYQTACDI